jgi:hypothetical protein
MEYQIPIIAEMVRQLLDYNPDTGIFIWRKRPISMFSDGKQTAEHNCAIWNGKWSGNKAGVLMESGYIKIVINRKPYRAHRLAWVYIYGVWPKEIDHINGVRNDNRIANLRESTRSENNQNKISFGRTSKYMGVCWNKQRSKWMAKIKLNRITYHLGRFDSETEAYAAYLGAKAKLHTFNPVQRE